MGSIKSKKWERWFKVYISKKLSAELDEWSSRYAQEMGCSQADVRADMRNRYVKQAMSPMEYYFFKLFGKTEQQKDEYASKAERHQVFFKSAINTFPRSKIERYKIFKGLFKRDVIGVTFKAPEEEAAYQAFIKAHPVFVVKPSAGTEGKGVFKATAEEFPDLKTLKAFVKEECLVEQLICQGKEMAVFHPESINTVRVVSTMDKAGKFQIINAAVRTGIGSSFVDNAGSGGILSIVDPDTGIIKSDGFRGTDKYASHPDSGVVYKGFQIPHWEELRAYVEVCHKTRPQQILIGWDFAWTSEGFYDVVEANPNPVMMFNQVVNERGVKPKFYMIKEW